MRQAPIRGENRNLDCAGKPVVLYAPAGPDKTVSPAYQIVRIFDDSRVSDNGLCELEVDEQGNLYLMKMCDRQDARELCVFDTEIGGLRMSSPVGALTGLYASRCTNRLFAYSCIAAPDAPNATLVMMHADDLGNAEPITVSGMGHITGMAEDPDTGMLWVVGFSVPGIPTQDDIHSGSVLNQGPFFIPRIAWVDPDHPAAVAATDRSDRLDDWTLPTSILWKMKR